MGRPTSASSEERLFGRVVDILQASSGHVVRSVNTAMVQAYWLIGREIVEVEQHGDRRADYGDRVIAGLAARLVIRFGKGFSKPSLERMRRFFLAYPSGSTLPDSLGAPFKNQETLGISVTSKIASAVRTQLAPSKIRSAVLSELNPVAFPPNLGWAHYRVLMRVSNRTARAFYEIEAVRESWSSRELERQVASLLFERLAKSRDKAKVLSLAREGQHVATAADVLKDPVVLEFLDLGERPAWRERDLEQAIIDRVQEFLLELGKGFCFVARQKRVTLEGDHCERANAQSGRPAQLEQVPRGLHVPAHARGGRPFEITICDLKARSRRRRART